MKRIKLPSGETRSERGIVYLRGVWFGCPKERRNQDSFMNHCLKKARNAPTTKKKDWWLSKADLWASMTEEDIKEIMSDKYKDLYKKFIKNKNEQ